MFQTLKFLGPFFVLGFFLSLAACSDDSGGAAPQQVALEQMAQNAGLDIERSFSSTEEQITFVSVQNVPKDLQSVNYAIYVLDEHANYYQGLRISTYSIDLSLTAIDRARFRLERCRSRLERGRQCGRRI